VAHREPHCADGREWGPCEQPETPGNGCGITIDVTGSGASEAPAEAPALAPAPVGQREVVKREGRAFHGLNHADTEPARLATGTERDAAVLDYQPAAPFADCLSDETIARGFPAVQ